MLDRLTLDQLRVLVAVAETGSFSAAARRLRRVQSAISQSVQALESALGTQLFERDGKLPKLTEGGRILLEDARQLLRGVEVMKARAESIGNDVEPELTLAVDPIFPNAVLMRSLKALTEVFPQLAVTLFTEGLGGPEQRLRDGVARLALYAPIPASTHDLDSEFLIAIPFVPVVAAGHPLAAEPEPLTRDVLERYVQLVLTDRTPLTAGLSGGVLSTRIWRFADLGTRLEYLLAGFGWCHMPVHMVRTHIERSELKTLAIGAPTPRTFPIHVIHERGRKPGRAGRWLIEDLRQRVVACTEPMQLAGDSPPVTSQEPA